MNYDTATHIYHQIKLSSFENLRDALFRAAIEYAQIRARYRLATLEECLEMEQSRTLAHNALISCCNSLSRNMAQRDENVEWRSLLGDDRKQIGDFACYLHCIFGIEVR
ncbi:MAG: hypothetical protein P9F75_07180 [Candidatus Contendobacter sp.]|nr:hypothetical protein [Candidatus Contendobacter sp.]